MRKKGIIDVPKTFRRIASISDNLIAYNYGVQVVESDACFFLQKPERLAVYSYC